MPAPKMTTSSIGTPLHHSVGAVIERDGKYLLIGRAQLPIGIAGLAGHVDEGEEPYTALVREIREESGLIVRHAKVLFEEELPWNICSRGITTHRWTLYACDVEGEPERNEEETTSIGWYSAEEIKDLPLESVWRYWFERLGVLEEARIIDERVRHIAQKTHPTEQDLKTLVRALKENCAQPAVRERYDRYRAQGGSLAKYPIDKDGYAVSFDPVTDERAFVETWSNFGIVVGKHVISTDLCAQTIARMRDVVLALSDNACDIRDPKTYGNIPVDADGTPFISRGFFELYHDDSIAQIRQAIRLYLHYVLIWGRADLWASFDRLGVKLPEHTESYGLPLHVDQNPHVHPDFKTVQGVLALADCPLERGTYVGVPGSRAHFTAYADMAKNKGEHVELDEKAPIAATLRERAQPFPLRAGDIVSWDSRTSHANSPNISKDIRFVMYQAAGPANEQDATAREARHDAFASGIGSNVREALMHASKPPRYKNPAVLQSVRKPEHLTVLGQLLYGQMRYEEI